MAESGDAAIGAAVAAEAAAAGRGRRRGMTAERVELEKSVFKQRLKDIMLWITEVLGEDVFANVGSLGVSEEWQQVQEKKLVQEQFDDNEKKVLDALENGVVLCKLMCTIVPGSCKGYVLKPKTPAACLSNLQAFIVACSDYGVEATFTSLDLFELKNLKTVVSCLNELGKRASKHGFRPGYAAFVPETGAAQPDLELPSDDSVDAANTKKEPVVDKIDNDDNDREQAANNAADAESATSDEVDSVSGEEVQVSAENSQSDQRNSVVETDTKEEDTKESGDDEEDDESEEYEEEYEEEIIEESDEEAEELPAVGDGETSAKALESKLSEGSSRDAEASTGDMVDILLGLIDDDSDDDDATMDDLAADAAKADDATADDATADDATADDATADDATADDAVVSADGGGAEEHTGNTADADIADEGTPDESTVDDSADDSALLPRDQQEQSSLDEPVEVPSQPKNLSRPSKKPSRPSKKPDEALSPRKPQIPNKPSGLSPKPQIPKKPDGLLSPRQKPDVPEKPASLATEDTAEEPSEDSDSVMEGWNRDDFAAKIMELRAELKRERRLREIAEKEVRKLIQEKKGMKRGGGKSLSLSSANVLKKKKARSSSVKGGMADNLRMQLEEKRRMKEQEEEARRELEEARKSKLSTAEQRQRLAVLHEILNTEKSYLDDLKQIQRVHTVLCADDKAATSVEVQTIFSNVAQILFIHEELTSTFHQRMEQCSVEEAWECAVGDIFLKLGDFLKIYTVYVGNQAKQTHVVEDLLQRSRFVGTLARNMPDVFASKQSVPAGLRSLLIKPIQRICKYPLLLRELIKCTEETHADKENLRKAMEHAESIAAFVNEKKKESEALMKLVYIQETVGDLPKNFKVVTPTRVYIREDSMVKISKGRAQERHFFLFNDLLLWSAKRTLGGKLVFKGKVPLNTLLVNDLADTSERKHTFELVRLDHKKKKYIICAKSEEEKQTWMHDLSDLVSALLVQANNERKGIQEEQTLTEYESQLAAIRFTSDVLDQARSEGAHTARVEELERQLQELKKSIGTDLDSQV